MRERAVRGVIEGGGDRPSRWVAIVSIAGKIGCAPQRLYSWVAQAEWDAGKRFGSSREERERIRMLQREVNDLRKANEILRKECAYFA